jgi:hypothetical protein
MATAAEAAVNFARRRGAATTAKWQADYDAWQKRDLLLDAVVLSLQNGGGFKIPWRDDRRSASRVVSVLQTTPMILDYETRSTVAGRRLHLRICLIGAPADLRRRHARPGPATRSTSSRVAPHRQRLWELKASTDLLAPRIWVRLLQMPVKAGRVFAATRRAWP